MKFCRLLNQSILIAALLCAGALARAGDDIALSTGQTLYLPIYSFLWHGNLRDGIPDKIPLSALVSIRNTNPKQPIRLLSARYYDTAGKQLNDYMVAPKIIGPLGTHELYVDRREMAGGSGANFLIVWQAEKPVNPPVIEAVHADIQGQRSVTFVTAGRPIRAE